eukprot:TRINITY_DN7870_c0_g1_i2.p1 TRINITY_DN7870_c0_g1~~TRINITY_DN7870_c0_g1_i2.p1  ORF type:complete len:667 (+),score=271.44 TRINITY_DN7870_c0_g1_i2:146-2146(+)
MKIFHFALLGFGMIAVAESNFLVMPPPQSISTSGPPLDLSPDFRFFVPDHLGFSSERLQKALGRYNGIVSNFFASSDVLSPKGLALDGLQLEVKSADETLNAETRYDYTLSVEPRRGRAVATAHSIYGAIYAIETLLQLVRVEGGRVVLLHSRIEIADAPDYAWRGLMIDSGRRFFPVALVENLLDTMVATKLNVLHLHASDMCRFGVQSNVYPNLTDSLTGIMGGFYSQQDIANLIEYAGERGIRVVPEFDVPGHSRGLLPIVSQGVQFCTQDGHQNQIYGDPNNSTYNAVTKLLKEMAGLFTDDVFNIGCDETSAVGPCTINSTFALERALLQFIQNELGKTPEGWEEVLFDAGAATMTTIVDAWSRHNPGEIISQGRRAVNSAAAHFYFTTPAPGGPSGWAPCWYDISTGLNASQVPMLLGGEMSMWSDTYCYIEQCGAFQGPPPVASVLFSPEYDTEFSESIGGMIWPRGYVAAASFWNYNASVNPASPEFVSAVWQLNDQLAARGALVCPSNCSCDQLSACGTPYIKAAPPTAGTPLYAQPCVEPAVSSQQWTLNADGTIGLAANASLCASGFNNTHPVTLEVCGASSNAFKLTPKANLVTADNQCLDLTEANMQIGLYECGSGQNLNQLNQEWVVGNGMIVSLFNGYCVTAVSNSAASQA